MLLKVQVNYKAYKLRSKNIYSPIRTLPSSIVTSFSRIDKKYRTRIPIRVVKKAIIMKAQRHYRTPKLHFCPLQLARTPTSTPSVVSTRFRTKFSPHHTIHTTLSYKRLEHRHHNRECKAIYSTAKNSLLKILTCPHCSSWQCPYKIYTTGRS